MSTFSGVLQLAPTDAFTTTAAPTSTSAYSSITAGNVEFGQIAYTPDARIYRYGLAGASNLAAGKINQASAIVANHQNMATSTVAIGATSITVTLGATAVTANQYSNGFLILNAGTGAGSGTYQILSHPAANSSATLVVTLYPSDSIQVATDSTTKASLMAAPYNGAIVAPTTLTGAIIGVNTVAITAAYFGWFQTGGLASCLNQGGTTVGLGLAPSGSVAGALATVAATTTQVAYAAQTGVDTEYRMVSLQLD